MITLSKIRNKLIEAIQVSGMTLTELSKRLGITVQTVSCYVHGKKMPALDTFANLCAILELDANDILCLNEYKPL